MQKYNNISSNVVKRLPRYYRFLSELMEGGVDKISSRELSDKMGITASQIRQDLNCFGEFGQQGYGYSVKSLHTEIGTILGLNNSYNTILIGAGNLGRAVALHMSFENSGFRLAGIFDNDKDKVGNYIRGLCVKDISELEKFCFETKAEAAILCLPKSSVPETAEKLYKLGIRYYWNFSHYDLSVAHDDVIVENVHLNDSLMILCYRISTEKGKSEKK